MRPGCYIRQADIYVDIFQRVGRRQHSQGYRFLIEGLEVLQVFAIVRLFGGYQGLLKLLPPRPVPSQRRPGGQRPSVLFWHGLFILPML